METVFHVSTVDQLSYIDVKVRNLIADDTVDAEGVYVVVDSATAVDALSRGQRERVENAIENGADLRICSNALKGATVAKDGVPAAASVVSSGVGELTRLQARGTAYIRP